MTKLKLWLNYTIVWLLSTYMQVFRSAKFASYYGSLILMGVSHGLPPGDVILHQHWCRAQEVDIGVQVISWIGLWTCIPSCCMDKELIHLRQCCSCCANMYVWTALFFVQMSLVCCLKGCFYLACQIISCLVTISLYIRWDSCILYYYVWISRELF